jgi:hypothetical protein
MVNNRQEGAIILGATNFQHQPVLCLVKNGVLLP